MRSDRGEPAVTLGIRGGPPQRGRAGDTSGGLRRTRVCGIRPLTHFRVFFTPEGATMTTLEDFHPVTEVTADDRNRIAFGKAGTHPGERDAVSVNDDGAILLMPLAQAGQRHPGLRSHDYQSVPGPNGATLSGVLRREQGPVGMAHLVDLWVLIPTGGSPCCGSLRSLPNPRLTHPVRPPTRAPAQAASRRDRRVPFPTGRSRWVRRARPATRR